MKCMKIQIDLSKELMKKLEFHKLRFDLHDKRVALVDVLERFFSDEDYEYFLKENKKLRKGEKTTKKVAYEKQLE